MSTPTWGQPQDDAEQAAAKKKQERKAALQGCGCLAGLGLGILLVIGACSASSTSSAGSTTTVVTQQATTAATTAAPDSPTPAAATTASPANTTAQQVAAWWTGGGQDKANAITSDFTAIGTDATNQDITSLATDCGTLTNDVADAQSYQALPDATAEQHWSTALADYHEGAQDCMDGANAQDTGLITRASGELAAGNTEMGNATARIQQISGSVG